MGVVQINCWRKCLYGLGWVSVGVYKSGRRSDWYRHRGDEVGGCAKVSRVCSIRPVAEG